MRPVCSVPEPHIQRRAHLTVFRLVASYPFLPTDHDAEVRARVSVNLVVHACCGGSYA